MTNIPDSRMIPPHNEYMEAYQVSINAMRQERIAQMAPEEQAKMAVLESVSLQLEEAKIPFVLWGNPNTKEEDGVFWRFNKLEYLPGDSSFKDRSNVVMRTIFWRLAPTITEWMTAGVAKFVGFYDADKKMIYSYDMTQRPMKISVAEKNHD